MTSNPTRLCLLGGVGLVRSDRPLRGRVARRHPLAVLAVLAAERTVPVTRDKLAALLWPESDDRRARRRLRVTLHALRKALGADAVVSVGDALHLRQEALACDLWAFEGALAKDAPEEAVSLYGGGFLDGFHLSGCAEFDQWVTRVRERLSKAYREALDGLAAAADAAGSDAARVRWLRLRVADDPYNEHAVVQLLDALRASGEWQAAVRCAEEYERRLCQDLGVEPATWLREQKARLRRGPAEQRPTSSSEPASDTPDGPTSEGATGMPARTIGEAETAAAGGRRSGHGGGRRRVATLLGLCAAALLTVGWLVHGRAADAGEGFRGAVVVLPFEYSGAPGYAYLSGGVVDLISRKVDGIPGLRAADPNALRAQLHGLEHGRVGLDEALRVTNRLQARAFVLGSILEAGGRLTIDATLYGLDGRVLGDASVGGGDTEVLGMLDRLTLDLLADRVAVTHSAVAGIAATTTSSVPALRAYLEGESLVREQRLDEAADRFRRATVEDSTFALAYYEWAVVESFRYRLGPAERAEILDIAQQALAHSERLTWRDREMLRGFEAFRRFDLAAAEAHLEEVLEDDPDDVEALYQLGEALVHINPKRGRSPVDAGVPLRKAVSLQPDHVFALRHLVDVALLSRDTVALDTLVGRLEALSPETARPYRFLADWMSGSEEERVRLLAGPTDLGSLQRAAELLARAVHALGDSRRVLRRIVQRTEDPAGAGWYGGAGQAPARAMAYDFLAHLDGGAGRRALASAHLDSAEMVGGSGKHLGGRLTLAFWPFLDFPPKRVEELLEAAVELPLYHGRRVDTARVVADEASERYTAFVVAHLAARAGDTARYEEALAVLGDVRAIADSVFPAEFVVYSPTSLERAARAYPDFLAGRWSEVVEVLQAPGPRTLPEENRWMLARALDELGRDDEALRWYGSFDAAIDGPRGKLIPPYALSHYYRGRIHEARGNARRAASHYARFLEVWRAADPPLRPTVEDARRRLAGLDQARPS